MTNKKTMAAVVLTGHGGFDKLEYRADFPMPEIDADEVLIRVLACGLNNTDVNTRTGWYSRHVTGATTGDAQGAAKNEDAAWGGGGIKFPHVQGADVVGVVEAAGDNTDSSLIGKRVMIDTLLRDWDDPMNRDKCGYFGSECRGGFAEYTKAHHRQVRPINSNYRDDELATFITSYTTAENMLNRASVGDGDTVLITGASGGVGSALIQLVKRRGATAVALASEEKAAAVRAVGADAVLPRRPQDLAAALAAAIGKPTVSVIADVVGGEDWQRWLDCLQRGGRYTCSGAIAGPVVDLDLRILYLHDLTFFGCTVVTPNVFPDIITYIEREELKPLLAATYPLAKFVDAQRAFIAKKHVGNIVVAP